MNGICEKARDFECFAQVLATRADARIRRASNFRLWREAAVDEGPFMTQSGHSNW